jgi:hypothetical protein
MILLYILSHESTDLVNEKKQKYLIVKKKRNHNPFNRMKTQKSIYWHFNKTATTNPEKYYSTRNNPNKPSKV